MVVQLKFSDGLASKKSKYLTMRTLLILLILTMITQTTSCGTTNHQGITPLNTFNAQRAPYTGMNDLLFPAAPVKSTPYYEGYRFEPIVYRDEKTKDFELFSSIFVKPNVVTKHSDLSKAVKDWYAQQQKTYSVKFKLIKQSNAKVAHSKAKYLLIESKGFGEELEESDNYRHHVYLFPTGSNSIATIRLSRLKDNDKTNSELWRQWPDFIESIKNMEPDSAGLTTTGQSDNTRRYYAHNLNFDVPMGEPGGLNKWAIKNAADRKDTWITKNGNITLNISLIDGYDFSVTKKSERYQQESDAFVSTGAEYFGNLTGKDLDYEKITIPFGKNNTFYGYIQKSESYSELGIKAAYKTGRAIKIKFDAKNEVFDEYKDEIVDWVKNIIILP